MEWPVKLAIPFDDISELEHLAVKNSTLITTENWKLLQFTFDTLVR